MFTPGQHSLWFITYDLVLPLWEGSLGGEGVEGEEVWDSDKKIQKGGSFRESAAVVVLLILIRGGGRKINI